MNLYIGVPQKNGFRRRKYIFPFLPRSKVLSLFRTYSIIAENHVVRPLIYKYGFANWIPSYACVDSGGKSANNVSCWELQSLRLPTMSTLNNQQCQQCQQQTINNDNNVNNVSYWEIQSLRLPTMSTINNHQCQQCQQ